MSRDSKIKAAVMALMAGTVAALAARRGLGVEVRELLIWLALIAAAAAGAVLFHRRRHDRAVLCLTALIQLAVFVCLYSALMYLAAMSDRPLIDVELRRADEWLGLRVPDFMAWSRRHPALDFALTASYHTIQLQTVVLILVFGLRGERRPLEACLMRLLVAALITLGLFAAFPAAGPFTEHGYGFVPSPIQCSYLEQFDACRSGRRDTVSFYNREGLVVFPSFHTAWAVILTAACRRHPRLLAVFFPLNLCVILSTMTTGMHYAVDVIAGVAVAAVALTRGTDRSRPPEHGR